MKMTTTIRQEGERVTEKPMISSSASSLDHDSMTPCLVTPEKPLPLVASTGGTAVEEDDSNTVSTEEESVTATATTVDPDDNDHPHDKHNDDTVHGKNSHDNDQDNEEVVTVERQQVTVTDHKGFGGTYSGCLVLVTDSSTGTNTMIPHGHGTMQYESHPSVSSYTGHWSMGAWQGHGQATLSNGNMYSGEHFQGRRHGSGTYQWADGKVYAGNFCKDVRHGQGTNTWPCGSSYSGDYHRGIRTGYGKYTDPNEGISYQGDWKDGLYHGYGILSVTVLPDGEDDKVKNSDTSLCLADLPKRVYRGHFHNGKAHGHGVEINPDGTVRHDGQWHQGVPLDAHGKPIPEEVPSPVLLVVQNIPNIADANGCKGTYRGILHVATGLPHGNGTLIYDKSSGHSSSRTKSTTTSHPKKQNDFDDDQLDYYEGCFDMGHYHGTGRLYWKNGDVYYGEYVQGKRHGKGVYRWSDGREYKGEFQNDMRHGFGKFVYGKNQNADWYEGEFVQGRREGKGRFVFADGSVYDGEWKQGLYHGQGTLISVGRENGKGTSTYTGTFDQGVAHGQGTETDADGTVVYDGNWIHGDPEPEAKRKAQQRQRQITPNHHGSHKDLESRTTGPQQPECEAVVDAEVVDAEGNTGQYTGLVMFGTNKPHGVGRMVYLDGRRIHEGFWSRGMKEGHGRCMFLGQGDYHEGEYKNNVRHGPGMYRWADGRIFKGHYKNDLRNGHGTFVYPHGERYEGTFLNGEKDGHGRFEFCGGFYEGEWSRGKYHGRGLLSSKGKIEEGVFRDGEYVGKATCDVHSTQGEGWKVPDDVTFDPVDLNASEEDKITVVTAKDEVASDN